MSSSTEKMYKRTYGLLDDALGQAFRRYPDGPLADVTLAVADRYNDIDEDVTAEERYPVFRVLDWPDELPLADVTRVFSAQRYCNIERWITMLMTQPHANAPYIAFTKDKELRGAAHAVIGAGNVTLAKILIPVLDTWDSCDRAALLASAASNGRVEALQWLHELWPEQWPDKMCGYDTEPFHLAAEGGHVPALDWMWQQFTLSSEAIVNAFEAAAVHGHVAALQWFVDRLGKEAVRTRLDDGRAYRTAAANGHDDVVQWFEDTFNTEDTDNKFSVRMQNDFAYRMAVKNGNDKAVRHLKRRIEAMTNDTGKRSKLV